ncbi:MAG: YigZ family protein [Ruminococcaceae bacterium]|nr:YigZ family protein [Oscillospiraceae bacterium]
MDSYITVKELSEYRFEDRKSVFIGYAKPVSQESDAIEFIQAVKKKHPDARHWVYAYVLRENSTARFTDDREPQGTAGMPVLDIIRKNGVTDTIIVVVRYFGGILLGTGGLVHAYTEAALGALKAAKIIKYDTYSECELSVSYSDYQKIGFTLTEYDFYTLDTEYSDCVKITGSVISSAYDELCEKLSEITSGRCKTIFLNKKYDFRE